MEYIIKSANKKVSGTGGKSAPVAPAPTPATGRPNTVKTQEQTKVSPATVAVVAPTASDTQQDTGNNAWQTVLEILSEESGVEMEELGDDVSLSNIGIDSLLSLVISGRLRDDLEVDLPDGALFTECVTIADLKKRVAGANSTTSVSGTSSPGLFEIPSDAPASSPDESDTETSTGSESDDYKPWSPDAVSLPPETPMTPTAFFENFDGCLDESVRNKEDSKVAFATEVVEIESESDKDSIQPAWSMYLQGSRKRSSSTLFLFPDGCGASTSYLDLPTIHPTVAVVGFNSPFMKTPHLMYEHTLRQVLHSYLAGVRGRQPHGPYHLGGWSAGGIIAYALAAELLAAGETVASLTLIDSPPPDRGLDHLPERFFTHCLDVGLFGTEMARGGKSGDAAALAPTPAAKAAPAWLLPHFRATIDLLHDYHAPPLSTRNSAVAEMKVAIIWAGECALDGVRYPKLPPRGAGDVEDEEGVKFLAERRVDFGPGRWAGLFPPGVSVSTHVVEGEHHFGMMRGAGAERLVDLIKTATGIA